MDRRNSVNQREQSVYGEYVVPVVFIKIHVLDVYYCQIEQLCPGIQLHISPVDKWTP